MMLVVLDIMCGYAERRFELFEPGSLVQVSATSSSSLANELQATVRKTGIDFLIFASKIPQMQNTIKYCFKSKRPRCYDFTIKG